MNDNAAAHGIPSKIPDAQALTGNQWRELCCKILAACEQLRINLAETEAERKEYLRLVLEGLPDAEVSFTEAELLACRGQKPTLRDIIADLERPAGMPSNG
jgi:hypothetical protein